MGPNDHIIRKCGVIRQSYSRVIFNTYVLVRAAEGGQRNEVRSRSNLDLAPSELRYTRRSASRLSSLPVNRDCQQTTANATYCTKVGHTRSFSFICVSQAAQTIYESPTARSSSAWYLARCLGASIIHQSRCTRRTCNSCLSRPSVGGAYFRNTQEKQLLGYQLYCFQYVAAVVFLFIGVGCAVSSIKQLVFLIFSCPSCAVFST